MRKLTVFILLLSLSGIVGFANENDPDISGTWLTANKKMKVKITQEKEVYIGRVLWQHKDVKQKYEEGSILLHDLKYNKKKQKYTGHFFYGKIKVKSDIELAKSGNLNVKMRIPGRTHAAVWTKVSEQEK